MISREEKWAELAFAKNSGIVIGDAPVSYWSIFPLSPVTVPEVFAKVNSAQLYQHNLLGTVRKVTLAAFISYVDAEMPQ